jgi:hypothetical protein
VVLAVFNLIGDLVAAALFVNAIDARAIIRQIEAFSHLNRDAAYHPMLRVLGDCLCRQITFNEDLEDVPAILLLEDVVHTGFKLRERYEAVEGTLTNPVSGFVVMRIHGQRELRLWMARSFMAEIL